MSITSVFLKPDVQKAFLLFVSELEKEDLQLRDVTVRRFPERGERKEVGSYFGIPLYEEVQP